MSDWLARIYPSSFGLAARIGVILIGAVVLSVGISTAFIFIVGEGSGHLPLIPAKTLAEEILSVYRRIDAAPQNLRAAATGDTGGPITRIDWPAPPPRPGPSPPPGYLSDLKNFIQVGLDNPARTVVVDMGLPPDFANRLPPEGGLPTGPPPGEEEGPFSQPPGPPPDLQPPGNGGGVMQQDFVRGGLIQGGFIRSGFHIGGPMVRVSMQLGDGSWVAVEAFEFLVRVVPISAVSLLLALFVIRGFMRPIVRLGAAAERLGIEGDVSMLEESGAPEMRTAARAFNQMQLRLRRLIDDRTQMLAAISHDLKTPLTRLRLRAEFVEDPALQEKMLADLADMEAIVASTLAFARSDARSEAREAVDLAVMLQSLLEAHGDSGAPTAYEGLAHLTVKARPVALRRALGNLIDNAIKYGGSARVALRLDLGQAAVTIEDEGPGIPLDQAELVFRPYYRLEGSRSRETGGVGLGLSIARAAIRAEGGEIALSNRAEGGLRVRVSLPLSAAPA